MATAILQDRRTVRAAGIVERHEVSPVDDLAGWYQVRDTVTGSGAWHLATSDRCDCRDALRGICKHQFAARKAEAELSTYGANWDARAEVQRPTEPTCPDCGARLASQTFYIGGKGYQAFMVCTRDAAHRALPA